MIERNEMAIVMGGAEMDVTLRAGGVERVKVLLLDIEQYPKLLASLEDERTQVELYCGRPPGWARTLTPAAHDLVMKTAEELNRDFFSSWVQRRMAKLEVIKPGLLEGLVRQLAPSRESGLPGSSLSSPGSVGSHLPRPGHTPSPG